jgi:hypothetical protein
VCEIGSGAPQIVVLLVGRVIPPVRGDKDAGIEAVPAAVHVRVLRLEEPAAARSRAA